MCSQDPHVPQTVDSGSTQPAQDSKLAEPSISKKLSPCLAKKPSAVGNRRPMDPSKNASTPSDPLRNDMLPHSPTTSQSTFSKNRLHIFRRKFVTVRACTH